MQMGLFNKENRLEKLNQLGNSLIRLNKVIQWELFRSILAQALRKDPKGPGGRPPYDCILMFKMLVLQRIYNLSDNQTEFQINDCISFMRFLGLHLEDRIPDAKTIWLFRDPLTQSKVIRERLPLIGRASSSALRRF